MPDIIDLSNLLGGTESGDSDRKIDTSGRPAPKDARVQLNTGVWVKCDVRYDGMQNGDRRYLVVAELDWENYWPKLFIVGECCTDVVLCLKVAGLPDDQDAAFTSNMQTHCEKLIEVR